MLSLFDPADLAGKASPATGKSVPARSGPPGHEGPRDGHAPPRAGLDLNLLYAFDWSVGRGVTAIDPNGMTLRSKTLRELIRDLPPGAVLVGEATFESYDLARRQDIIDYAAGRDVALLTVPARGNTRRREAAGFGEKTSQSRRTDREDAIAIWQAAVAGAHLKVPAIVDPAWAALREQARQRFIELRWTGQKDTYARSRLRCLPPYMSQPSERRIALGPAGGWNLIIVAAVAVAAEFTANRKDFERLTGWYSHGYPSQFRSDLMHWGWNRQPRKRERITLSVYRRELRWLFHELADSQRT